MVKEFEEQFEYLRENTEKYITFPMPIKKEKENGKIISCKMKFINILRFMSISLWNLVDNLTERLQKDKCRNGKSGLEYMAVNNGSLVFKYEDRGKNYEKEFDEDVSKRFENIYKFCDDDIIEFSLMLPKDVYSYEYMDS